MIIASASEDFSIIFWDYITDTQIKKFEGHYGKIRCIAFNVDGTQIISGCDDKLVILWDC